MYIFPSIFLNEQHYCQQNIHSDSVNIFKTTKLMFPIYILQQMEHVQLLIPTALLQVEKPKELNPCTVSQELLGPTSLCSRIP